jgi:hypothetical protein
MMQRGNVHFSYGIADNLDDPKYQHYKYWSNPLETKYEFFANIPILYFIKSFLKLFMFPFILHMIILSSGYRMLLTWKYFPCTE